MGTGISAFYGHLRRSVAWHSEVFEFISCSVLPKAVHWSEQDEIYPDCRRDFTVRFDFNRRCPTLSSNISS